MYLLNKKAYSVYTKQDQKELFKKIALKRVSLTDKELKQLNPANSSDPESIKVFRYDKIGMTRFWYEGKELKSNCNKHLSLEATIIGKEKAGYGTKETPKVIQETQEVQETQETFSENRTIKSYDELLEVGKLTPDFYGLGEYIAVPGTYRLIPTDSEIFGKSGEVTPDTFFKEYKIKIDNKYVPIAKVWLK